MSKITIITKTSFSDSNSSLAQGGVAVATCEDDIEQHIIDTINAGGGINDRERVKILCEEGYKIVRDLQKNGIEFDKNNDGELAYSLEGAHSVPRVVHIKGDSTGKYLLKFVQSDLQNNEHIRIIENRTVIELLTDIDDFGRRVNDQIKRRVTGLRMLDEDNNESIVRGDVIILATGGIGQIYSTTSNHMNITADGLALGKRAGAKLCAMEYVQFHPTLYDDFEKKLQNTTLLISEAVRGAGGKLRDEHECAIMQNVHKMRDLAPRDVISRQIFKEEQNGHKIALDVSEVDNFSAKFPHIFENVSKSEQFYNYKKIPVTPGAHFFMGGLEVDENSETNISGLFAIGEVAFTNVHGANRLASNSLLECLVFAKRAAKCVFNEYCKNPKSLDSNDQKIFSPPSPLADITVDLNVILSQIWHFKQLSQKNIGIIRNNVVLREYIAYLANFEATQVVKSRELMQFNNMVLVAREIAAASLRSSKNIGAQFKIDT